MRPSGFTAGSGNASSIQGKVVSATAPTNGQLLAYNSSTGQWEPTTEAGAGLSNPVTIAQGGTARTTPGLDGVGTIGVAASGTWVIAASDSYTVGQTFVLTDALGVTKTIRCVASPGVTGGTPYAIPVVGGGVDATTTAKILDDIFNGTNTSGAGPFPALGLDISSVRSTATLTLTQTTTGAAGNVTITTTGSPPGSVAGMSGGVTAVSSTLALGTDTAAGKVATAITIGRDDVPVAMPGDVTIGSLALTAALPIAQGGSGATSAAAARTAYGLAIGSDVQAYDADLSAVAGLSSTGIMVRTGSGTAAVRAITVAQGITISNADGVSGNVSLGTSSGGDVSGALSALTVAKINGATLGTTTTTSGRVLVADGSAWQSVAVSGDATLASTGALTVPRLASLPTQMLSGTDTLSAGTVTVTAAITASSRIVVTIKDANPGAGGLTVGLEVPVASRNTGAGTFVVRANVAAGTINTLDTSTFDWIAVN